MGSEKIIRDRHTTITTTTTTTTTTTIATTMLDNNGDGISSDCILYSSDADDDLTRGVVGCRRIHRKKNITTKYNSNVSRSNDK